MGGTKEKVVTVPQAKVTPPSAQETTEQQLQAQLSANPQLAAQYVQLQQQYSPILSALQQQIRGQIMPQEQALQQQLYPQQSQVAESVSQQALQGLGGPVDPLVDALRQQAMSQLTPTGLSPEQQQAQGAIRGRQVSEEEQRIRTAANLGGGLFGGRRETREDESIGRMRQAFAQEDIARQQQQQAQAFQQAFSIPGLQQALQTQAIQQAIPIMQQLQGTPITQLPMGIQPAAPSAESIASGSMQAALASQPQTFYQQAQPSPAWGALGQLGGGLASGIGMGAMMSSKRYKKNIKLWAEQLN